jgi:hypothetical protein
MSESRNRRREFGASTFAIGDVFEENVTVVRGSARAKHF